MVDIVEQHPEYIKGHKAGEGGTIGTNPHKRQLFAKGEDGKDYPVGDNPDYFAYNAGVCDASYKAYAAKEALKTPDQKVKEEAVRQAEADAAHAKEALDEATANLKEANSEVVAAKAGDTNKE